MKKVLTLVILSLFWFNFSLAENSYDFFKKELEYSSSKNIQTIYAHNSHPSKKIFVEKMEVVFKTCGSGEYSWDNPDRVYLIKETINPGTDKTITVNARYTVPTEQVCIRFWTKFVSANNTSNNNTGSDIFVGTRCVEGDEYNVFKNNVTNREKLLLKEKNDAICLALVKKEKKFFQKAEVLLLIILVVLGLFTYFINKNSQNKSKTKQTKIKVKKIRTGENLVLKVWEGNESLSKTFWTYVFFGGIIVGVLIGFVGAMISQLIYLLGVAYTIWSCVGLWRSSTNYKIAKIRAKQSYGWATAAKVYAAFNIITWLSQLGFILSGTM